MYTLDNYLTHARHYGTESVYESAVMAGGDAKSLALLRIELDSIDAGRKSGGYSVGKRRKRTREETAKAVEVLSIAGLTRVEIAAKLGGLGQDRGQLPRICRPGGLRPLFRPRHLQGVGYALGAPWWECDG